MDIKAWFNHLLFGLLPPKLYLRLQGIELYDEPSVTVTVTYRLHGDQKQARVKLLGGAWMAIKTMIPLWLKHGFCEPVPELSPYIPPQLDNKRYYVPPYDILKVEWYDPVLEDVLIWPLEYQVPAEA